MRYFLLCLLFFALALVSCQDDDVAVIEAVETDNEYIEPAMEHFREPADLKITYKKARNFNKASEALVIMGQDWAEKMAQMPDEEKLQMAASYEKAQDDLIRKFGINGKEEFKWIHTKALMEPANKEVFARAGVWINNK